MKGYTRGGLVFIAVVIIVIVYFYCLDKFKTEADLTNIIEDFQNNEDNKDSEQDSMTYEQSRNFILKWSNDLKKQGIYNNRDVISCVNSFKELAPGQLPDDMASAPLTNEYSYGLYDRTPEYTNKKTEDDSEVQDVFLVSYDNKYLISNDVGNIRLARPSEFVDSGAEKTNERLWRMVNVGGEYAFQSIYDYYLVADEGNRVKADMEIMDAWSKWKLKKVNGKWLIISRQWDKSLTATPELTIKGGENENQIWKIVTVPESKESAVGSFDTTILKNDKKTLLGDLIGVMNRIVEINNKIELNRAIKDEVDDKKKEARDALSIYVDEKNNENNEEYNEQLERIFIEAMEINNPSYRRDMERKKRRLGEERYYEWIKNNLDDAKTQTTRGSRNKNVVFINKLKVLDKRKNKNKAMTTLEKYQVINQLNSEISSIRQDIQNFIATLVTKEEELQEKKVQKKSAIKDWENNVKNEIKKTETLVENKNAKFMEQIQEINRVQVKINHILSQIDKLEKNEDLIEQNTENTSGLYLDNKYNHIYVILATFIALILAVILCFRFWRNTNKF